MAQERDLPLFPLNTVLFPGGSLPLQIFEPRYKQLLLDVGSEDNCFGVVLIKEGMEVGGYAVPHDVGTVAEITQSSTMTGGRIYVVAQGVQRFRILRLSYDRPYLMGRVLVLDPPDNQVHPETLQRAQEALAIYLRALEGLRGGWVRTVEVPNDPALLAHAYISTLRAGRRSRQALLEMDTLEERLQRSVELAKRDLERIRREVQQDGFAKRLGRN
jgi:Lon protease-like protein